MKIKHLILISICLTTLIFLNSCDKHHAKKLSGTYKCAVNYRYWDMTGTNIDSNYTEDLEIQQDGKSLKILDCSIHIDSLWKGNEYHYGEIHNYIEVQFKGDSIYVLRSSGGLGGNGSRAYKGKKMK